MITCIDPGRGRATFLHVLNIIHGNWLRGFISLIIKFIMSCSFGVKIALLPSEMTRKEWGERIIHIFRYSWGGGGSRSRYRLRPTRFSTDPANEIEHLKPDAMRWDDMTWHDMGTASEIEKIWESSRKPPSTTHRLGWFSEIRVAAHLRVLPGLLHASQLSVADAARHGQGRHGQTSSSTVAGNSEEERKQRGKKGDLKTCFYVTYTYV